MSIEPFVNKVFHGDALALMGVMPTASIDAIIADAMYGTSKNCLYDWGLDPAKGHPVKHWAYHQPIYEECRRVLKPGGVLAWRRTSGSMRTSRHGSARTASGLWPASYEKEVVGLRATPGSCRRRIGGPFAFLTGTAWCLTRRSESFAIWDIPASSPSRNWSG